MLFFIVWHLFCHLLFRPALTLIQTKERLTLLCNICFNNNSKQLKMKMKMNKTLTIHSFLLLLYFFYLLHQFITRVLTHTRLKNG